MTIPTYNYYLKKYSRELRTNSTLAEVILWNEGLKQRKMGYQFNRQKPLESYIVDFFCKALNLIIELDGITHEDGFIEVNKSKKDFIRQKNLENKGYNVIRFKDEQIVFEFDKSLNKIRKWICDYENKFPEIIKYKTRNKLSI